METHWKQCRKHLRTLQATLDALEQGEKERKKAYVARCKEKKLAQARQNEETVERKEESEHQSPFSDSHHNKKPKLQAEDEVGPVERKEECAAEDKQMGSDQEIEADEIARARREIKRARKEKKRAKKEAKRARKAIALANANCGAVAASDAQLEESVVPSVRERN